MNTSGMAGGRFQHTGSVDVRQSSIESAKTKDMTPSKVSAYIAEIIKVYPDRFTCDIKVDTEVARNVPLMCKTGLINGEVWGDSEFPNKGDSAIVLPLDRFNKKKIIIGTFCPYLMKQYQGQQKAVNSTNKTVTKKLIETGLDKTYRKIFKSGTTIEVKEDGTVLIETPSGILFNLKETDGTFHITDKEGNDIHSTSNSIVLNGNLEVLK